MTDSKKKYEAPGVIELGMSAGNGQAGNCRTGSIAVGECLPGQSPGVCNSGGTADFNCTDGVNADNSCNYGGEPVTLPS